MTIQRESRRSGAGGGAWDKRFGEAACRSQLYHDVAQPQIRHGRIEGNVWRKTAQGSRHQLHKPPSWAVDCADLEAAEALGVEWLEIHDVEAGVVWSAPLSAFRRYGLKIERGFGAQIALPLSHWSRRKTGEAEAQQLTLWAEVTP